MDSIHNSTHWWLILQLNDIVTDVVRSVHCLIKIYWNVNRIFYHRGNCAILLLPVGPMLYVHNRILRAQLLFAIVNVSTHFHSATNYYIHFPLPNLFFRPKTWEDNVHVSTPRPPPTAVPHCLLHTR